MLVSVGQKDLVAALLGKVYKKVETHAKDDT